VYSPYFEFRDQTYSLVIVVTNTTDLRNEHTEGMANLSEPKEDAGREAEKIT